MNKKTSNVTEPTKTSQSQLELPLTVRSASVLHFPLQAPRAMQSDGLVRNASERILAFAAELPDW